MDVYEAISKRQTIRDFDDKQIPTDILLAPSLPPPNVLHFAHFASPK